MSDNDVRDLWTTAAIVGLPLILMLAAILHRHARHNARVARAARIARARREYSERVPDLDGEETEMSDATNDTSPKSESRKCDSCRKSHLPVRYDPGTRMTVCNPCWFRLPPKYIPRADEGRRQVG